MILKRVSTQTICCGPGAKTDCRRQKLMLVPSKKECFQIIYEMEMLDHIVVHSIQVCRVAVLLVDHLKAQNIDLNRDLVQASALLHDITKTRSIKTREDHALTGGQLISDLGYPEVEHIVRQHVLLDKYFASEALIESEIVNYADKRILHDKVVSLQERMNYILEKYAKKHEHRQQVRWFWRKTETLEDRIFSYLPFSPEELGSLLKPEDCTDDLQAYRLVCMQKSRV